MKKINLIAFLIFFACQPTTTQQAPDSENQKEFDAFMQDVERDFIYLSDKQQIVECIKQEYRKDVDAINSPYDKVLFYENLLNEFYDSHINLNTNTDESYRLSSPIHIELKDNRFRIKNVFASQLDHTFDKNIIKAEVLSFNGLDFEQAIQAFPTKCHDKNNPQVKEWLANKVLSGKRNEARIVALELQNGEQIQLDIDGLQYKNHDSPLSYRVEDNIGIISINNSLGNSDLVDAFDQALDQLMDTKALILDLRNTPGGGNTGVAEPMMGRFISEETGYQVCENKEEKYTRTVSPRKQVYEKPLYILAGRWTGSMGEGMTIGFDGMKRATIVGTELNRLAGGMKTIKLLNSNFGGRISFEKMYHLNGTLRETFVPAEYINQQAVMEDEFVAHAMQLIVERVKD